MEVRKLNVNDTPDFKSLIEIFNTVFQTPKKIPEDSYLNTVLSNQDFLAFVVKVNDLVVGGLTIYVLPGYTSTRPIAYIYDVAIVPNFQRKGLGKALIQKVSDFCAAEGYTEMFVEAERDDVGALAFYRKTKAPKELSVRQFTYLLGEL